MFEPSKSSRVFALPPGADFSQALVEGLDQRLSEGPPEAMARVEIFVNTRRMQRRLNDLLASGPARLLPSIRLITDLARDTATGPMIPAAVSPLRRRLELSQAVAALIKQAPDIAPQSAVFDLADSLAKLMDEMSGEGVNPQDLRDIDVKDHSAHWERSLQFLNILTEFYTPENDFAPDIEARQRLVVERLCAQWREAPPTHPVIVAGSTGSRGATALFMQAVARLPQGAIVLPGFDFDTPPAVWQTLREPMISADHPQSGFGNLLSLLKVSPDQVLKWSAAKVAHRGRNKLVSLALRPAPVTDQWLTEGPDLADLKGAAAGLGLLEATSQRQEALAIALCLRHATEVGKKATLISPDRVLTRMVTSALERWKIIPDDSAGEPLPLSPPGIYLRLTAAVIGQRLISEALLILLKHPLTHSDGSARNFHLLRSRDLELQVLRRGAPFVDFDTLRDWAAKRKNDPDAVGWVEWLAGVFGTVENVVASDPLADHLARHRRFAENLAAGPFAVSQSGTLWTEPAGITAAEVFAELEQEADAGGQLSVAEYTALLTAILNRSEVREPLAAHPDITIWGTLEARVQGADLVILGGLNDGSWPKTPKPDPWLNRAMRKQAGLLLPERQIGLSAHDFQQAIAGPEVLLTRSVRDADAPTVASRWIIRLTNLLSGLGPEGKQSLADMQARGNRWADMAILLETPDYQLPPEPRPSPRPPVEARPKKLSVTRIKTLIRDPYAIYAQYVLDLKKPDPLRQEPDAPTRGKILHTVLEEFVGQTIEALPDEAEVMLLSVANSVLEADVPWPAARRMWLARLKRIAAWFVEQEKARRDIAAPIALERSGEIHMGEPDFTLTANADRIDLTKDGRVLIFDYKTGTVPSGNQIKLFDKQLPLEGKIAQEGGFDDIAKAPVAQLEYIGLGGDGKSQPVNLSDDLINETWESLRRLIRAYQNPETGYTARARMEKRTDKSDTDHLSRRGEWDDNDRPVTVDLT